VFGVQIKQALPTACLTGFLIQAQAAGEPGGGVEVEHVRVAAQTTHDGLEFLHPALDLGVEFITPDLVQVRRVEPGVKALAACIHDGSQKKLLAEMLNNDAELGLG
jgi:hypothetical protein